MSEILPPVPEPQRIGCQVVLDNFQLDYLRIPINELLAASLSREVAAFLRGFLEDHPEYVGENIAPHGKAFYINLSLNPP